LLEVRGTEMNSIDDVEQEVNYFLNHATESKEQLANKNHNPRFLDVGTILTNQQRVVTENEIVVSELRTIFPWATMIGLSVLVISFIALILLIEGNKTEDFRFSQKTQITN
jgi:membrane-associated HD superfamily phosphohydrolase